MDKIPHILHLYWDRSKMSWLQALTVFSFHRYNPDWKINVYTPKQAYTGKLTYIPNYTGKDYFYLVEKSGVANVVPIDLAEYGIDHNLHNILRSDILRYHLLYKHGGVWSDFDVIWLKPMEHFRNIKYHGNTPIKDVNTVVSFIGGVSGGHSIGVMIHCKNDPYALSLINLTKQVKPPYDHEVFGSLMINRAYPNLASLSKFENVISVKFETYYPYIIHPFNRTIQNLYTGVDLSCINNNVMCVHWYNGHELSKHYVNNNGINRRCSMTDILKNEGYIYVSSDGIYRAYLDDHLLFVEEKPAEIISEVIPSVISVTTPEVIPEVLTEVAVGTFYLEETSTDVDAPKEETVEEVVKISKRFWLFKIWDKIKM